jgi:hypothetical protein
MGRHEELESVAAGVDIWHPLLPGEQVVAHRGAATLDRRQPRRQRRPVGDLYLTSARLLFVGSPMASIPLESIEDAILIGARIQLMLRGGVGILIDVDRPQLLREQIADARAAQREDRNDP